MNIKTKFDELRKLLDSKEKELINNLRTEISTENLSTDQLNSNLKQAKKVLKRIDKVLAIEDNDQFLKAAKGK